jgi:hypothetical protein
MGQDRRSPQSGCWPITKNWHSAAATNSLTGHYSLCRSRNLWACGWWSVATSLIFLWWWMTGWAMEWRSKTRTTFAIQFTIYKNTGTYNSKTAPQRLICDHTVNRAGAHVFDNFVGFRVAESASCRQTISAHTHKAATFTISSFSFMGRIHYSLSGCERCAPYKRK